MDLTNKEISNSSNSDLYLSILLKNTPEEKAGVLRDYRKKMSQNKNIEHSLMHQNNDVLTAVQNLVDSSNEIQILLSLEIENILLSELESCQQVIDKQKKLLINREDQLVQKRENEKTVVQSIRKFKEENQKELTRLSSSHQEELTRLSLSHQEELTRLSSSHQEELTRLSSSHQEEIRKITEKEKSPSLTIDSHSLEAEQLINAPKFEQKQVTEEVTKELFYKLIAWPDFNGLTKGDRIIPLATRLMAQQMSLKQMELFLGGPTEKEKLLLFIDELSSIGLLTSTHTKEESTITSDKPEKNNRLQLFKRIRSSLGI
jgi:vacuolar-type H+-ATPase subunit I/STV1